MAEKPEDGPKVIRDTDDEARHLARVLLRSARSCALAVLEPETGAPFASLTLTGTDTDGVPVILVSSLSVHTKALRADKRASLLCSEPGKGDPLAHPRLTVLCEAEEIDRGHERHGILRARFLRRHPKSKLYVDFPDFSFFLLRPIRANLNGGFGKAFILESEDLLIRSPARLDIEQNESELIETLLSNDSEIKNSLNKAFFSEPYGEWRIVGIDAAGVDLSNDLKMKRLEFSKQLQNYNELRGQLLRLLKKAKTAG